MKRGEREFVTQKLRAYYRPVSHRGCRQVMGRGVNECGAGVEQSLGRVGCRQGGRK